jgi:hypothetical protein
MLTAHGSVVNRRGRRSESCEPVHEAGHTASGVVEGVQVGCFPDLYAALSGNPPDQLISL